jgi:glycine hydroxymethyltransferase
MTGSAGKTFSGPQSGVMVWNDPELTPRLLEAVFPALAATHQVNRVAALAAAAAELLAFGPQYMQAVVDNAQTLACALHSRGVPVLGAGKGFTRTHQVIADVREFGGGLEVAHRLAEANLITNKNLLPNDEPGDWDRPSGLRIGTTEVTRLGMGVLEMQAIADMMAGVLVEGREPAHVCEEAKELRAGHQRVHYCFSD